MQMLETQCHWMHTPSPEVTDSMFFFAVLAFVTFVLHQLELAVNEAD